jgi:integrase
MSNDLAQFQPQSQQQDEQRLAIAVEHGEKRLDVLFNQNLAASSRQQYLRILKGFCDYLHVPFDESYPYPAIEYMTYANVLGYVKACEKINTAKLRMSVLMRLLNVYVETVMLGGDANKYIQVILDHKLLGDIKVHKLELTGIQNEEHQKADYNQTVLSEDNIDRLLDLLDGDDLVSIRQKAIICLMLDSGVRRSEVASLKWTAISPLHVLTVIGKGKKERQVKLTDFSLLPLERWKAYNPHSYIFVGITKDRMQVTDKPIHYRSIYNMINNIGLQLGVQLSPHSLRRTMATDMANSGTNPVTIRDDMGHSNIATTSIYLKDSDAIERRRKMKRSY